MSTDNVIAVCKPCASVSRRHFTHPPCEHPGCQCHCNTQPLREAIKDAVQGVLDERYAGIGVIDGFMVLWSLDVPDTIRRLYAEEWHAPGPPPPAA